jgi:pimeloyl-ACP methyl ester carboxylesterase
MSRFKRAAIGCLVLTASFLCAQSSNAQQPSNHDFAPAIAPNGVQIAFHIPGNGYADIYVTPALVTPQESPIDEDITIRNGNISLGGTLSLPPTPGPHPGIVIVHGSGRATRTSGGSYDWLVDLGFAVVTVDKRGVGESTGAFVESATNKNVIEYLASHVLAWRASIQGRSYG